MWKTTKLQLNKSNIFGSFTILEYTKPCPLVAILPHEHYKPKYRK